MLVVETSFSQELQYHWNKYINRLELLNHVVQSCKLYDLYQEKNYTVIKNLLNYIGCAVEGLVTCFFFTKTKRAFGTKPKARAGWPKRLGLVRATPSAKFDETCAHM